MEADSKRLDKNPNLCHNRNSLIFRKFDSPDILLLEETMKKLIALSVLLLCLGSFAFASDALTMPQGVGRVVIVPTFSFAGSGFNDDGERKEFASGDTLMAFNLGLALEYGVLPWISAAIQWTPGWTPWSDIEALSDAKDSNTNGVADLFVGAKIQIIGQNAPVQNEMFRFAVAPGVIIPLPGPDFKKEVERAGEGKEATLASMDRHVLAFGGRFYFDWVINENFYLNLFNETLIYPIAQDLNRHDPTFHGGKGQIAAGAEQQQPGLGALVMGTSGDINYKYRLTFEIEPVYSTNIADGIRLTAGLPITYRYNPAPDITLKFRPNTPDPIREGMKTALNDALSIAQHSLYVTPVVGVFLTNTPLPLEFKLQYGIPVWGMNTIARHNISAQIQVYFAIPSLMGN